MRIHTVRSARHQRHAVLAGHNLQLRRVIRVDFGDAIHLVAKRMAHHIDIEVIANPHLIQTRKH